MENTVFRYGIIAKSRQGVILSTGAAQGAKNSSP